MHPASNSNSQGFSRVESPLLYNFCFLRLPDVLGTRFTPAINSCGLSSDGLQRLLSRSDDPEWGVAALCCHRPPGTTWLSRSWRCSLTPTREVLARPSARLSQRACCLKKLFTCQGTPCRRGQTVTGSGTGRAFRLGSPSILLSESALGFVPCFALSLYNGHSTIRPKIFSLISLRRLKRPAERAQKTAENFLRQLLRFIKKIRKLNIFRLKKPVLSCIIFK